MDGLALRTDGGGARFCRNTQLPSTVALQKEYVLAGSISPPGAMRVSQDNNDTSPRRKRCYRRRPDSGNSRAVQTKTPQPSPSRLNGNTSMDSPQQSGTPPGELMAEMQSMLATLRLRKVSDAKDDIHEKFLHIESDMDEMKKAVMEIGQKVGHVESDVGNMKRELADFNSMEAALAVLQEQHQMLLNGCIMPSTFSMYPSNQPPPGV